MTMPNNSRRRRIVVFVPWITQGRGGTENVGQFIANGFARRGHEVSIVTFDDARRPSRWPLAPSVDLIHAPTRNDPDSELALSTSVAALNPDVLIGLHMNRTHQRYVRCAHRIGCPLILSEHTDPRFSARAGTFAPEERWIAFSGATRIHLLVDAFRETLPDFLQPRIRVIPNAVPKTDKVAHPEQGNPVRIVCVARLVPRKAIGRLISAVAEVRTGGGNCVLDLVGDGPERRSLRRLARSLGIARHVNFVGEVADPGPYYAQAHIFALPSIYEAFPMASLEAIAHGLPVIGYGICNGINVQVLQGETGLLSSGGMSEGSLAADIARLVADPALRARMGQAGRARARALYSPDAVLQDWADLVEDAIAAGPPGARPDLESYLAARCDDLVWGDTTRLDLPPSTGARR